MIVKTILDYLARISIACFGYYLKLGLWFPFLWHIKNKLEEYKIKAIFSPLKKKKLYIKYISHQSKSMKTEHKQRGSVYSLKQ